MKLSDEHLSLLRQVVARAGGLLARAAAADLLTSQVVPAVAEDPDNTRRSQ